MGDIAVSLYSLSESGSAAVQTVGRHFMLGHYSSGFTLDTYTHITEKMQQGAAEKMGNFMKMEL